MYLIELRDCDFDKGGFVRIRSVVAAIGKHFTSCGINRFQAARDAWPFIHTGIVLGSLHPMSEGSLSPLSVENSGDGVLVLAEVATWLKITRRFKIKLAVTTGLRLRILANKPFQSRNGQIDAHAVPQVPPEKVGDGGTATLPVGASKKEIYAACEAQIDGKDVAEKKKKFDDYFKAAGKRQRGEPRYVAKFLIPGCNNRYDKEVVVADMREKGILKSPDAGQVTLAKKGFNKRLEYASKPKPAAFGLR